MARVGRLGGALRVEWEHSRKGSDWARRLCAVQCSAGCDVGVASVWLAPSHPLFGRVEVVLEGRGVKVGSGPSKVLGTTFEALNHLAQQPKRTHRPPQPHGSRTKVGPNELPRIFQYEYGFRCDSKYKKTTAFRLFWRFGRRKRPPSLAAGVSDARGRRERGDAACRLWPPIDRPPQSPPPRRSADAAP